MAVQKSIAYYENALKQNWKNVYVPFNFIDCDNCLGIELNLGRLYGNQAEMQQVFKDETVQKFRKSIAYYEMAKANIYLGRQYLRIANVFSLVQ